MKMLLLFGGTTEGRILAGQAAALGYAVTLCVATEYGREVLPPDSGQITVKTGRLDLAAMTALMQVVHFACVVDATHPYAVVVSQNILAAAKTMQLPYFRLLREQGDCADCCYAESTKRACMLVGEGNIFATTGSKEIAAYILIPDYRQRVYARVLPTPEALALCRSAGLADAHILTGKGPFTVAQNEAVLRDYQIKTMITKDGGVFGGFAEKLQAAKNCGTRVIVVRRPAESDGYSATQILQMLKEMVT